MRDGGVRSFRYDAGLAAGGASAGVGGVAGSDDSGAASSGVMVIAYSVG